MIRKCEGCKPHAYQDTKYGKNMRVYTKGVKPEHAQRCTVCDREHKVAIVKK